MASNHVDEMPAVCFTGGQPISEDEMVPVFAVISLHQPLKINQSHDRQFRYMGALQTLPITYLCQRHRDQVDLPLRLAWPMMSTRGGADA